MIEVPKIRKVPRDLSCENGQTASELAATWSMLLHRENTPLHQYACWYPSCSTGVNLVDSIAMLLKLTIKLHHVYNALVSIISPLIVNLLQLRRCSINFIDVAAFVST